MKSFLKSIILFWGSLWFRFFFGLILLFNPLYSSFVGIESGFSSGVLFGGGWFFFVDASIDLFIRLFKSKKQSLGSE